VRIDRTALPFVLIASVPAAIAALAGAYVWAAVALVLPIAIALFFRDPDRTPPADPSLVLAPADGSVIFAGDARPAEAPPGAWRQVTIFLSPLDVHINRTPVSGRVTRAEYVPGTFRPAYHHDAFRNEHSEVWVDHGGQTVVFRQVVGVLARRVVCRVSVGDDLAAGARVGLMKFGSRMDVFVPPSATLSVRAGDRVRAALTVIARLGPQ
jgi:phosphatidylserine decarboxylase